MAKFETNDAGEILLPKQFTMEAHLLMDTSRYTSGNLIVSEYNFTDTNADYILITKGEVTFDIPQDLDIKGIMIAKLKEAKKKVQANAHMKCEEIEERINQLQALEYYPSEGSMLDLDDEVPF